jgi:hypothetical protein
MKEHIHLIKTEIDQSKTLNEAGDRLRDYLKSVKNEYSGIKIGYVSGVVTSYGSLTENLNRLAQITEGVRDHIPFSFSAGDIFSNDIFNKFNQVGVTNEDYLKFWEKVLPEVTDFFMTSGWKKSKGSTFEYELARSNKARIFTIDESGRNLSPIY